MAGFYDSNKTGKQVDDILDSVATDIGVNPSATPDDWFDGIRVGDKVYKLIGSASPSVANLFKHTFTFSTSSGIFSCVAISNTSTFYTTMAEVLANFENFVLFKSAGLTIISVNIPENEYYCLFNGSIAKVPVGSALVNNHVVVPY